MARRALVAVLGLLVGPCTGVEAPEDFVNALAGTFTQGDRYSTGNTFPVIARPWGFNHWSVMTNKGDSSWWFSGNDHVFKWLRCTHQPSPWIGDWGQFMFGPQMGGIETNPTMFWEPRAAEFKPHVFDARLAPDGIRVELTPTMHGAVLRVTFPEHNPRELEKRVCFQLPGFRSDSILDVNRDQRTFSMVSTRTSGGVRSGQFHHYVRVEGDAASADADGGFERVEQRQQNHMICLGYAKAQTVAVVRIASSFISFDQAKNLLAAQVGRGARFAHLDAAATEGANGAAAREEFVGAAAAAAARRARAELPTFDDVLADARAQWRSLLSRVDVVDADGARDGVTSARSARQLGVLYTGLYRAFLFPRRIDEPTGADGAPRHWSPYAPSGALFDGPLVTDNGFWDTFRTVYPLLTVVAPDELGLIVQGWVNAYKEGGWIPKWASPGYRNSMVGTFGDVVIADAIVKGIGGFEREAAWDALRKDAYEPEPGGSDGSMGKVGLRVYEQHGFIPYDAGVGDCVSRTLDFGFADAATSRAARALGKADDATRLQERATEAMRKSFDASSGLMLPHARAGSTRRVDPTRWGDTYTEGAAWHHSFPPYDMSLLASLHGGNANLAKKLHQLLDTPGTFGVGGYGQEIHEMTEMRALAMGQYSHNNQPAHHLLWLFTLVGERNATCDWVRFALDHAYGVDFFSGDEDNGENGAWFVLAALGLYDVAPGTTDDYVLGSPLFRHVVVRPRGAAGVASGAAPPLHILAPGTARDGVRVREVWWHDDVGHSGASAARARMGTRVDGPSVR